MAEVYSYGLKCLKFGEPTGSNTMPTLMEEKFNTFRNTAEFSEEDAKETPQYSDQMDDPFLIITEKGAKTVKVSTYDYSPDVLKFLKGGTIVNGQWHEPAGVPQILKAVEMVTDTGLPFQFPKAQITAKFNAKFTKDGVKLLDVTIKPLATAADAGAVIVGKKTE